MKPTATARTDRRSGTDPGCILEVFGTIAAGVLWAVQSSMC